MSGGNNNGSSTPVPVNNGSNDFKTCPMSLRGSDNPGMSIVTVELSKNNYMIWSRAIKMALCAKDKLGFIDGRLVEPELMSPLYDSWKRIDGEFFDIEAEK
ncbi:hypothetical protein Leryth_025761 [Lithospermum erythrorhizon]|nr:hypothetical protein Leryth_025761 [Lithospermum erythrorhizon]